MEIRPFPSDLDGPVTPYTWLDFPLDASTDTLYLDPHGMSAIVTVQYVTSIPTLLEVNEHGEVRAIRTRARSIW